MDHAATEVGARYAPVPASAPSPPRPRRTRLWLELGLLALAGILLVAGVWAAVSTLNREFYSPSAFVERYLTLLADGSAAEALAVPGVTVDSAELEEAGLPPAASEALLRRAALATLSDIEIVDEAASDDATLVTATYRAGDVEGTTTFSVVRDGQVGFAPTWRFARSPLAVVDVAVEGSMEFMVNGFEVDKRQVSPDGVGAAPDAPVAMLVFSPGLYTVSVDTAISATPGVAVLSDSPFSATAVDVRAQPTNEFTAVVQTRVEEFLAACATQEVLQPTACPFGYYVQDRIASPPQWSITRNPLVALEPDGAEWVIAPTEGLARIDVDILSLFDGSVRPVSEEVPFLLTARITVQPDGTATILVGGPDPI